MNFHTTPKTNVKRITDIHIGKMIEQMLFPKFSEDVLIIRLRLMKSQLYFNYL
ncbi:MAG: hypothetical protein SPK24_04605 [Candidatus Limisoma sp.]|nr:hypothetical protein [Candidatus Limisoma sp.]